MTAGRTVRPASSDWGTPVKYVTAVCSAFGGPPSLDPCSGPESVVGAMVSYRPPADGLREDWDFPSIYVNPPYGRDYDGGTTIRDWLERCSRAHHEHGSEVIALVPVATNTRHWKLHVFGQASLVCFLADTRLRFRVAGSERNKGCPMAVAAVYWGRCPARFAAAFSEHGALMTMAADS